MRRTILTTSVLMALVVGGVGAYFEYFERRPEPKVATVLVTTGDIVELVKATGTLAPRRSVDVGTQVSGTVTKLYVDFNSIVKKGQLLATLDPATYRNELESARAAMDVAQIALDEEGRILELDRRNLERTRVLLADQIAAQQDLDELAATVKEDEAQVVQDQASVTSAKSGVRQAEMNLSNCTIHSPIDGVVISRNVDEGQTVSARMTAPSLYLLGADLQHLQVTGDVDEANMARLRPGQPAMFTVEAYPAIRFGGSVTEVRLNATTINTVVTYQVVIDAPNPDLRLLPGMTANLTIETSRTGTTLRVPNRAVHFQPTPEMFTAFRQPVSPGVKPGPTVDVTPKVSASVPAWRVGPPTIDEFFEPLPATKHSSQLWVMDHGRLTAEPVELGLTDGTWTQILSGRFSPGEEVVSSVFVPPMLKGR
jgi:HlyD family secretion protein